MRSVGYEPRFDIDLRRGERGEVLFESFIEGFGSSTYEVKTDDRALQTGNVYLEHACRGRDGIWRDSGIVTTEATWWVFVIGETVVAAPVARVRLVHLWALKRKRFAECPTGENPTKGVTVPMSVLLLELVRAA